MQPFILDGDVFTIQEYKGPMDRLGLRVIDPESGIRVCVLLWQRFTGEIKWVETYCEDEGAHYQVPKPEHKCYRRRGCATALLQLARQIYPDTPIHHSVYRSDKGEFWARSLNEPIPPRGAYG